MVKKSTSLHITCDNCKKNSITVDVKDIEKTAKSSGWKIETNSYPITDTSISRSVCPDCVKIEYDRNHNSDNITDRLKTNYYSENPGLFDRDVLIHLGLEKHPRGLKLMKVAYSKGHSSGYSEIFNEALELSEILID